MICWWIRMRWFGATITPPVLGMFSRPAQQSQQWSQPAGVADPSAILTDVSLVGDTGSADGLLLAREAVFRVPGPTCCPEGTLRARGHSKGT
jgi:hypothetical protein